MNSLTLFLLLLCVTFSVSTARPLGSTADADTSKSSSSTPAAPGFKEYSVEYIGEGDTDALKEIEERVKGTSANVAVLGPALNRSDEEPKISITKRTVEYVKPGDTARMKEIEERVKRTSENAAVLGPALSRSDEEPKISTTKRTVESLKPGDSNRKNDIEERDYREARSEAVLVPDVPRPEAQSGPALSRSDEEPKRTVEYIKPGDSGRMKEIEDRVKKMAENVAVLGPAVSRSEEEPKRTVEYVKPGDSGRMKEIEDRVNKTGENVAVLGPAVSRSEAQSRPALSRSDKEPKRTVEYVKPGDSGRMKEIEDRVKKTAENVAVLGPAVSRSDSGENGGKDKAAKKKKSAENEGKGKAAKKKAAAMAPKQRDSSEN